MLVSSHTISLWFSWNKVPERVASLFPTKSDYDVIAFIPTVLEQGPVVEGFLKALNVTATAKLSDGVAYLGRFANEAPSA
jgi:hypothetical protein